MSNFSLPYQATCALAGEVDTVEDVLQDKAEEVNAPLPFQLAIANAIKKHREVVVVGANAIGKSHMLSRLIVALVLGRVQRRVIVTAVKDENLKDIIFSNVDSFWQKIEHHFPNHHKTLKSLYPDYANKQWFAAGKVAKVGWEESYSGQHSKGELIVLADEGTRLEQSFFNAWNGLRKSGTSRLIIFCNGLSTATPLYQFCQRPSVYEMNISALEHPNVVYGRPLVRGAVSKEEVELSRIEDGEDSYEWIVRVLGLWFEAGTDNILPLSILNPIVRTKEQERTLGEYIPLASGVDIARQGKNQSICYEANDIGDFRKAWAVQGIPGTEIGKGPDIAGRMGETLDTDTVSHMSYDADGIGATVGDYVDIPVSKFLIPCRHADDCTEKARYKEAKERFKDAMVNPITEEPNYKFANLMSEMYWRFREYASAGRVSIPDDNKLKIQLSTRKYAYNQKGEILVQSKEEWMKENGEDSSDDADAMMWNFHAWLVATGEL